MEYISYTSKNNEEIENGYIISTPTDDFTSIGVDTDDSHECIYKVLLIIIIFLIIIHLFIKYIYKPYFKHIK